VFERIYPLYALSDIRGSWTVEPRSRRTDGRGWPATSAVRTTPGRRPVPYELLAASTSTRLRRDEPQSW
jgi:hypothetical protein